jgi:hypothetical protein
MQTKPKMSNMGRPSYPFLLSVESQKTRRSVYHNCLYTRSWAVLQNLFLYYLQVWHFCIHCKLLPLRQENIYVRMMSEDVNSVGSANLTQRYIPCVTAKAVRLGVNWILQSLSVTMNPSQKKKCAYFCLHLTFSYNFCWILVSNDVIIHCTIVT